MTLFIYGDSFACLPAEYKHLATKDHRWPYMVAKYLGHLEKNYGLGGSALEYSFTQIANTKKDWASGDILLLCETELVRRWFIKELPSRSTFNNVTRATEIADRDKKWIQRWFIDFHNIDLSFLQLKAYYYMLNAWCIEKDVTCHVIRCFDRPMIEDSYSNILFSIGDVLDAICYREFKVTPDRGILDTRIGHFSTENHVVIASAIIKAITNKKSIDFNIPFKEKFL
jgi:hypothetical protein